jgi:uncharacterized membrane protein
MIELTVFLAILAAFGYFDIRAMNKGKLKKEILAYLLFSGISAGLGIIYFSYPFRDSIAKTILSIFNILR